MNGGVAENAQENGDTNGKAVRRVTWIGLVINLLLCGLKFGAGVLGRSQAVVADAVHSLSDSSTDIAILVGSHFWMRPPDVGHPYGHRRIETLTTLFIGAVLATVGIGLGWNAVLTMHAPHASVPGPIAFWAALVSIVCKEWMYRWTFRMGRRLDSLSLEANAWHHRSDAFSSIPAALAVAGALVFPKWVVLDHVGAVIVAVFILRAAWKVLAPTLAEITESGASRNVQDLILRIARRVRGVRDAHGLRSRYVGRRLHVDLNVLVDADMRVRDAHDVATEVSRQIRAKAPSVLDVVVHVEPDSTGETVG